MGCHQLAHLYLSLQCAWLYCLVPIYLEAIHAGLQGTDGVDLSDIDHAAQVLK